MGNPRPPVLLPLPVSAAIVLVFLAATAGPFAASAAAAFEEAGPGGLGELLSGGRIAGLFLRSLTLAALAATLASALGVLLGRWLARLEVRGRWLALGFLTIPFTLSPVIVTTGFLWALGPAGWAGSRLPWNLTRDLGGPALVLGLTQAPLPAVLLLAGRMRVHRELFDAALLLSGPARASLRVALPLLLPHLAAGWLLVFLIALFSCAVPSLCRQSVLAEEILVRYGLLFNPATAAFLGFLLAMAGLLLLAALRMALPLATLSAHGGRGRERPPPLSSGGRRAAGGGIATAVLGIAATVLASVGIPLSGHLSRFPPLAELPRIAADLLPPLGYSVALSAAGAAAALCLGYAWSLEVHCGRLLRHPLGELLGLLPLCLPGPLLAIGLIHLVNREPLAQLLDGPFALAAAKAVLGSPYAFIILFLGLRTIPEAELEALALSGRSPWGLLLRRLAVPAAFAFWLCFVLGLGETDLALLLAPPGTRPLPVKIYTIYHFGAPGDAAALSLALSLLTVALSLIICLAAAGWRRSRPAQRG